MATTTAEHADHDELPPEVALGAEDEGEDDEGYEDDEEGDDEAEAAEAEPEPPPPRPRRRRSRARAEQSAREREDTLEKHQQREQDLDIKEWLGSLGLGTAIRIDLQRTRPTTFQGVKTSGTLETYDDFITEEDIREEHGGGTYLLRVKAPNPSGSFVIKSTKTVHIAGDPKIDALRRTQAPEGASKGDGLGERAFAMMERQLNEAKRSGSGELMAILEPMREQVAMVYRQLEAERKDSREKDERILQLISTKPDSSERDSLMQTIIAQKESELKTQRESYQDEIRRLSQDHRAEIERMRDRHHEDLKQVREDARRYSEQLSTSSQTVTEATKISLQSQIDNLTRELARKDAELASLKEELKEARAKKDRSIFDQIEELSKVKASLGEAGILGGDDEGKGGMFERLVGALEPLASRFVQQGMLGGGQGAPPQLGAGAPAGQQQLAAPQQPPPIDIPPDADPAELPAEGQLVETPDGNVYIRRGQQLIPATPEQVRRAKAAARARQRPSGPTPPAKAEVQRALGFIEVAFQNGTDAKKLANSARSMVSGDVIDYLKEHGADSLLSAATLESSSPLKTQAGRQYIRDIADALVNQ